LQEDYKIPLSQNILYATTFFRNKNISKKLKLRLKDTIINKTLTYASKKLNPNKER
jgi:hypothetical protein